jgi:hypothetical protein
MNNHSPHCHGTFFNIDNDNDRWFFVSVVILHELVHCFEPLHIDLELNHLLYCSPVNVQQLQDSSLERIYEQGEIFETMVFGGVVGRIDARTLRVQCSESDSQFNFVINDDNQLCHFFVSYDLTII